jgi:phosphoglycolate phosphatase-like HAD superfamily hydrolase
MLKKTIVWDLDHTLMNTEREWFAPIIDKVALRAGRDRAFVEEAFKRVNTSTFTFSNFFQEIGLSRERWRVLEDTFRDELATRAQACLYQGIPILLWELRPQARQVLVTAGDPAWQRWKFEQLHCLKDIFAPEDRHFVPMDGSKADAVERYREAGDLTFVDDSVRWQREVHMRMPGVRHIRPIWPHTDGASSHPDDDIEWTAVRTIDELRAALD